MASSRTVLVTASSKGIGRYIAEYLYSKGYRVIATSRNKAPKDIDKGVIFYHLDFTVKESIDTLYQSITSKHEGIDGLVVNTGNPSCEPCTLTEAGYEDWLEAAKLYLAGPLYLTSKIVEYSINKGRPLSILFISAVSVAEPMSMLVVADTVRAGITRAVKVISRQYASHGIRANALLLGSYDTPGARSTIRVLAKKLSVPEEEAWRRLVVELNPGRKLGDPTELGRIAHFILFEATYISGTSIVVDGAMSKCTLV